MLYLESVPRQVIEEKKFLILRMIAIKEEKKGLLPEASISLQKLFWLIVNWMMNYG